MYLTQGLHRAVQQQPDEVMTIFGARRRTFRAVADRVARLAGALRELGVGDGDRVAMLALNSDRYNEYLLAVPWAGAVLNPVNFRWSVAEIAYSLRDSGSRVLLVDDVFAPMTSPGRDVIVEGRDGPIAARVYTRPGTRSGWVVVGLSYRLAPGHRAPVGLLPLHRHLADLRGLPPATVITCGHDVLLTDGVRLVEALRAAGVETRHTHYDDMPHGFLMFSRLTGRANQSIEEMAWEAGKRLAAER